MLKMVRRRAKRTRRARAVRATRQPKERMVRNVVGFVLAFVAGIFATIQGYQAVTAVSITGNVVGVTIGTGIGGLAVILGILILVGSFLMIVTETVRFGAILVIVLGVLTAIVTQGASIVPSLIAVFGGFLGMTVE